MTPLAFTVLGKLGGTLTFACVRRRLYHLLRRATLSSHYQVTRPYGHSNSGCSHSTTTLRTSFPVLFAQLAAATAAVVAAISLPSPSLCETAHAGTEERRGERKAMREDGGKGEATSSATCNPSLFEHHDRVDTKLHRAYPEFLKVGYWRDGC